VTSYFYQDYRFPDLDWSLAKRRVELIRQSSIRPAALVFSRNLATANEMLLLPLIVSADNAHKIEFAPYILSARLPFVGRFADPDAADALQKAETTAHETFHQDVDLDKILGTAINNFERLRQRWTFESSLRSLLLSGISAVWTAFECLAIDMWVAVLNEKLFPFGRDALSAVSPSEAELGISGKQVSVGLLGKYGFDLRDKMGSVLRAKFDFTGVGGIKKAYSAAFGRADTLSSILGSQKLAELEATRHLIVHRAAVVDEDYKSRVDSSLSIGAPLPLSGITAAALIAAGIQSGCDLIAFVDDAISKSRP
jgi:hypothetical protein